MSPVAASSGKPSDLPEVLSDMRVLWELYGMMALGPILDAMLGRT